MNFNGRWVPVEVMDAIVLLWAMAAVVLCVLLFRFGRAGFRSRPDREKSRKSGRKKRTSPKRP